MFKKISQDKRAKKKLFLIFGSIFLLAIIGLISSTQLFQDKASIDIQKDKTIFSVNESGEWIISGIEYIKLYDEDKLLTPRRIKLYENETTTIRTTYYKNKIKIIDIYFFDKSNNNLELFPTSHTINTINAEGLDLIYMVSNLSYSGSTKENISSPQYLGHKMKVEWESGNYYSRIYKYKNKDIGKLEIKYRINSNDFSKDVRLFDPPSAYEYYDGLAQSSEICSPTSWRGQSFTVGTVGPNENFDITSVEVFGIRNEATGTVYAEIYAVDGSGYPTDDPLSSGSADFSSWDSYDYYSINMSSYELQASTQYALVLHATGEGVDWWYDATSPSYTGGKVVYSNNGGSSWGSISTWDFNFYVYGEAGDTSPPTLSIGKNDTQVEFGVEIININWSATDDSGVNQTIFNITYPNNSIIFESSLNSSSINLTTENLTVSGTYTINLWANDSLGNNDSTSDTFIVSDTISPLVNITLPSNNSEVSGIVSITANASDTNGVGGVQFYYCNESETGGDIASDYVFPLVLSLDNRTLEDQNGKPFLIVGDTAWELIIQLNETEIEAYLDDRQSKGFNSVIINTFAIFASEDGEENYNGEIPFTDYNYFVTPNENYFVDIDFFVNETLERDMVAILTTPYTKSSSGYWGSRMDDVSNDNLTLWGEYLGDRYKDYGNVIWVVGGDSIPSDDGMMDEYEAIATGILNNDSNAIITPHVQRWVPSLYEYENESWVNLESTYYGYNGSIPVLNKEAYDNSPTTPYFLIEGYYEGEHSITSQQIRSYSYWILLQGGAGYIFGNCPLWSLGFDRGYCSAEDWRTAANHTGSFDMGYVEDLFHSRNWYDLVPDASHNIMIAGYGTLGNVDYATGAFTSDNITYIAYIPTQREVEINLDLFSGDYVNVWWYNVSNGSSSLNGTYVTSGTQNFTSPTATDWVIVIEDNSTGLSAPGVEAYSFSGTTCTTIGSEDTSSPYSVSWNTSTLADGNYTLIAQARDSSNNTANSSLIYVIINNTMQDSTPPTFTTIPEDEAITYPEQWNGVDFDAEDETEFGSYSVNDTRFTINSTGFLDEVLTLAGGVYSLNITINDTSGNENSTLYILTVNKAKPIITMSNGTSSINSSGLVGYWRFEGTAYDSSGEGNDGTLNGGVLFNSTGGVYGGAYEFDGVDDYVDVGDSSSLKIFNELTFSIWLKSDDDLSSNEGYTIKDGANFYLRTGGNGQTHIFRHDQIGDGTTGFVTTEDLADGKWHNMIFIYNGSDTMLYMDGNYYAGESANGTMDLIGNNLRIGKAIQYWNGSIDEVMIFNRSLSSTEISLLYKTSVYYGTETNFNSSVNSGQSVNLFRNTTSVSNPNVQTLGTGEYYYLSNVSSNQNYTLQEFMIPLSVSKATPNGSISGTSPITYGTAGDVYSTAGASGDGGCVYQIFRDGILTSDPDTSVLGVGIYNYVLNTTGCTNYSANSSMDTFELTINQDTSDCGIVFNETSPLEYPNTFLVWTNCTSANVLMRNGTIIVNNSEQNLTIGIYNFSVSRNDTSNYSNVYSERDFVIQDTTPPTFTDIRNITQNNETSIYYNIDAADSSGISIFWINDTTNFKIEDTTGIFENNTNLNDGVYTINVSVNDTFGNIQWQIIFINLTDLISTSTYYSNSTGGKLYEGQDNDAIPNTQVFDTSDTELGSSVRDTVSADNNAYDSYTSTDAKYHGHRIIFNVSENEENISYLTITTRGIGMNVNSWEFWNLSVWNYTSSSYVHFDGQIAGSKGTLTALMNDNPSDFINDSGNVVAITMGGQGDGASNYGASYLYFTKLEVGYIPFVDTTPPTFTIIPENATITYNELLGVDFDAEDETEFDTFAVNDTTNFQINSTGFLSNATILGVGIYELNISINDTTGNSNSTIYKVTVNQNTESCSVFFNTTSPQTYPTQFIVYTNCTSAYTLYRNGTIISNNSEQSLSAGTWNFTVTRNDTSNYSNVYNEELFTINQASSQTNLTFDKTSPQDYGTEIIPYCSVITGEGSAILEMNGSIITSGSPITLGANTYFFNCSLAESTNYTYSENVSNFTIDKATPSLNINWTNSIDYGTPSDAYIIETNEGDGDVIYNFYRSVADADDWISVSDPDITILSAGMYDYKVNTTGGSNYSGLSLTMGSLTVNQDTSDCGIVFNETSSLEYPETFLVWTNCTSAFTLYRNGSSITNNSEQALSTGIWNFTVVRTDQVNYSNFYSEELFTILQFNTSLVLVLNGTTPITYGEASDVQGYNCPLQINCILYRNSTNVSNPDTTFLSAGTYGYIFNTSGNQNYTSASKNFSLLVNPFVFDIGIVSPGNTTYDTNKLVFNISSNSNLSSCVLSLDNFVTNYSMNLSISLRNANYTLSSIPENSNTVKFWCNNSLNDVDEEQVTFFVDTIYPQINYTIATEEDNITLNQSYIYINILVTEDNLKNITYYLYLDGTGFLASQNYNSETLFHNFTGLSDGVYHYNVTVFDLVGNMNYTETRNITLTGNVVAPPPSGDGGGITHVCYLVIDNKECVEKTIISSRCVGKYYETLEECEATIKKIEGSPKIIQDITLLFNNISRILSPNNPEYAKWIILGVVLIVISGRFGYKKIKKIKLKKSWKK